ncbi:hypothetical protein EV356DRAFT_257953 [Viridothelium virens]|uniref:Protein kinase domain-containing protein n=1 Tax=Viridothelium virens TaxID=1048519 RepID=A0A6A6H3A5_VIRVR|nr:hypothetical protein EV356DRAFT_257953 [Viridothelium virens]
MLRQRNPSTQFPSRLTKLYSDTKKSCNAVCGCSPVENAPELLALNRQYGIQKDRLMTWGLEWTEGEDDKAVAQGNIDQSAARAGLTEAVTSVLGNIKAVLDEAEHISKRRAPTYPSFEKGHSENTNSRAWTSADKSRYEDLVKDLTTSIDVLYDLSHARKASLASTLVDQPIRKDRDLSTLPLGISRVLGKHPLTSSFSSSQLTLVNTHNTSITARTAISPEGVSPRHGEPTGLPSKLDPDSLILPREEPPPYVGDNVGLVPPVRLLGQLKQKRILINPWTSREVNEAVFVEYATFDPIYRDTGVPPPLQRLEFINTLLQDLKSNPSQAVRTLSLIGYFEDAHHSRIGLVYQVPEIAETTNNEKGVSASTPFHADRRPTSLLSLLQLGQNKGNKPVTLLFQPTLEDRFRLAFNAASTLKRMHDKDIVHGDVNSASFIFFKKEQQRRDRSVSYDVRSPYLTAFDIFSDHDIDAPPARSWSPRNIYLHPEGTSNDARTDIDPRTRLDIYALGLVLLEIGLWTPLIEIFKSKYTLGEFKLRLQSIWAKRLASKCGSLYMKCVQDCLSAGDASPLTKAAANGIYRNILGRLTRCCVLDDSESQFEEDPPANPLHHAATHDGTTAPHRSSFENPPARPPLFSRHSGGYVSEKHDWNPFHMLRHPIESLHRPHTLSSIPSAASTLPLAYAGIASPPLTQEPTDMISERVEELQKELAQKEIAIEDLRRSYDAAVRSAEDHRRASSNSALHELEAHLHFKPSEIVHGAAKTIQNAWRNRMASVQPTVSTPQRSPTGVHRKGSLIQKHWRERQARRSETNIEPAQSRDLNENSLEDGGPPFAGPPPNILGQMTTEEPEVEEIPMQSAVKELVVTQISPREDHREKKKLRVFPVKLSPALLEQWHQRMGPQLIRIVERALKDSPETSSVDLLGIGDSQYTARPTIFITCSSVSKVKAAINRKLNYDRDVFDLKVRKGKIRRSHAKRRAPPVHRSMVNYNGDELQAEAANPCFHKRPLCGASIGAFRGEHLPPVSYGGVVVIDGKPYGMSVHHLLDPQSDTESEDDEQEFESPYDITVRSSAPYGEDSHLAHIGSAPSLLEVPDEAHPFEISDYSSEEEDLNGYFSDHSEISEFDPLEVPPRAPSLPGSLSELSESELDNAGDTLGVSPHDENRIPITQPALYDVPSEFFPSRDERDDEHLLSHKLGYVYASSGVRRVSDPHVQGLRHEVDWALFQLDPPRLQPYNVVQGGRRCYENADANGECELPKPTLVDPVSRSSGYHPKEDVYPMEICSATEAAGRKVCSFGRTSGLKLGQFGEAMGYVKIWGRKTFSTAWGVVGDFGVGGDSGAWVIETTSGKVCGHVLAYCKEKGVAYICPMDILFDDMKHILGADKITLPSADEPELVDMAQKGEAQMLELDSVPGDGEVDDTEEGALEADDESEDAASWDDDEGTAVSDSNLRDAHLAKARSAINDEDPRRKKHSLRIDTPSAGGLGVHIQGLGITTESPPHKEEHVLTHRLRDISPPLDRTNAFMPQMVRSPISGGPIL